jgi:hypothetical protein
VSNVIINCIINVLHRMEKESWKTNEAPPVIKKEPCSNKEFIMYISCLLRNFTLLQNTFIVLAGKVSFVSARQTDTIYTI